MRRVLIPLDGSPEAEKILPDARRLAGLDGELILVREAVLPLHERDIFVDSTMLAVEDAEWYLQHEAEQLRNDNVRVRTQSYVLTDPASAIDEAARTFKADMIAIATHGRTPLGRFAHRSVAWKALAYSPVPVLLRHVQSESAPPDDAGEKRRIMVPLDQSAYAEKALPLAQELALEWNAPLWLVHVVRAPDDPGYLAPYRSTTMILRDREAEVEAAHDYLARIAASLIGEVHSQVGAGPVSDHIAAYRDKFSITDVVMASHGRTGLSRVIVGSIADDVIHRLRVPVIVVPALAAGRLEDKSAGTDAIATTLP